MPAKDLTAVDLGTLAWNEGHRAESLGRVYGHAAGQARQAIEWYDRSRKPKKWFATGLRSSSVLLLSASGLVPLAVEVLPDTRAPGFNPLVTSLMVAGAAALFGIDKFFNYSSGWMRYAKTGLMLRNALSEFEFEWQIHRAAWAAAEPTMEQVAETLARCGAFVSRVNAIVAEETNAWIAEFQASLAQLGESVKAAETRVEEAEAKRAAAALTGAVNLVVQHDGKAWSGPIQLRVGKNPEQERNGPTVALDELPAGPRKVQAQVVTGGKLYRGEMNVEVVAGRISTATLAVALVGDVPTPPAPPEPPAD
jgi:hypothetical protein